MKTIEIRTDENTRITLRLTPDNWHLRTEYLEPGFENVPANWWAYKTPFVRDLNVGKWVIYYRQGEENIPHLNRKEHRQCADMIEQYENELPF